MRGLSASQQAGIIAHELAHFRRGDHWTRWLEFLVVGLYWWHPVAWFARRQLQQAEEFCCDAWVLRLFPDQARGYAQALLATVDFLSEVQTPAPAGASGFGHVRSLQRRLEMILKRTVRPELSPSARMLFLAAALAVLLWTPQAFSQSGAESSAPDLPKADASVRAASSSSVAKPAKPTIEERLDRLEQLIGSLAEVNRAERDRGVKLEPPAAKTANTRPDAEVANRPCDTSFLASRFKHRVSFETGRTQTKDGGRIEIREVWGTRPQIEVGGQYLVRGRYVLPPGERGMLYFYASAGGPWGQTASLDLQSTAVDKQEGEFALIHGMAGPGYFHLILTDAERYSRWFADVYFGTGDNVYRTKPLPTPTSTAAPPAQESVATTLGPKAYREGDVIEISGVTATSGQLEQGDSVTVRGRVRLQSQPSADLSLYLTQTEGNGIEETDPAQIVRVSAGLHDFVLKTTIKHRGALHLTLYDPVTGKPIGGTYFGTADQMQKITKWDVSYYLKK